VHEFASMGAIALGRVMVTTSPAPVAPQPVGEKRVAFHHLNWQAYQQILQALGDRRGARLTYDRGKLEITMPLEDHEFAAELIGRFVYFLVTELGQKVKSMRSTTLEREDLDRSPEPDHAFYLQNWSAVAGRNVDFATDPPPDLVLEVDITHTDIDKVKLYAALGVPEFWRYNGRLWRIYQLQSDPQNYSETETSAIFPFVTKEALYQFLTQARHDEVAAEQTLRAWVRKALQ
jgi:Uma2 family endonuclease